MALAAHFLVRERSREAPADPVARFHRNGARGAPQLGRRSLKKGRAQSCGMMVNYLYVPDALDDNLARLGEGNPRMSRAVAKLL